MKKLLIILLVISVLFLVACNSEKVSENTVIQAEGSGTIQMSNEIYQVKISNFKFMPTDLEIKVGDTVQWNNEDYGSNTEDDEEGITHTITLENGDFDQKLPVGASVSYKFTEPGMYPYFCLLHPEMRGTVIVN